MKLKQLLPVLFLVSLASCDLINKRTVNGNGNLSNETRNVNAADKVKLEGTMDVDLIPGTSTSVKVIADQNLLQYIETRNEDGGLLIKVADDYKLKSSNPIKVEVTTPTLQSLEVAGHGNINGKGKFTGASKLEISLAGNSNVNMEVNTPSVEVSVAGSGDIGIKGETKKLEISIAGSGNFKGDDLKAEEADISVAGSGDVHVFADTKLDVEVMGSGNVYYKGSAQVKSNIMGSGKVVKQ